MSGTDATPGTLSSVATDVPGVALPDCFRVLPWSCPIGQAQVYRFFDEAGRCLYVGMTSDARTRMQAHLRMAPWLSLVDSAEWGPAVWDEAARREEVVVTELLRPLFSKLHNPDYRPLTRVQRDALYAERLAALIPQAGVAA